MEEAAFLTDKMIYELGLSNRQTEDVYQINYDYFTQVGYSASMNARAAEIRMRQLEYVLTPNQFRMCQSIIYFLTPAMLHNGEFYFRIYVHYDRGVFYFDRPSIYRDYRGIYKNNIDHYQGHRPTGYFFHNGVMSTEPRPMHPGPGQPGGPAMPGQGHRPGGNHLQPGGHPGGSHAGTVAPPPANRGVNTANPNGGQRSGGVNSSRGNGGNTNNVQRPNNGQRPDNVQRPNNGQRPDNVQRPDNNKPATPNNADNGGSRRTFGQENNANNRPANAGTNATPSRQNTQPATTTRGNSNTNTNSSTNSNQSNGGSSRFSGGSTGRRGR